MLSLTVDRVSTPYFSGVNFVTVLGLGLVMGIAALVFSTLWVLLVLVVVGFILAILKRPELLPLIFLVLTSTVITYSQAPISIGFGTLYITDVVLLFSFGYITARSMMKSDFKIVRTPLDWPLLIFWGASLISTLIAILDSSLPWKQSLNEVRVAAGYLMFFAVTNLVRDKRQLTLLIKGFFLLATVVALAMIVQYLFGSSWVFLAGRIEDVGVEVQGEVLDTAARIIQTGQSMIMVALIALFATLVFESAGVLRFLQCGLLALAVVLTFFRASWVAIGVIMLIIGFVARGRERKRLIVLGLVATVLGSIILIAILYQ